MDEFEASIVVMILNQQDVSTSCSRTVSNSSAAPGDQEAAFYGGVQIRLAGLWRAPFRGSVTCSSLNTGKLILKPLDNSGAARWPPLRLTIDNARAEAGSKSRAHRSPRASGHHSAQFSAAWVRKTL
jgi:hypothetical protein